jgi:hypothetical protein
MDELEQSHSPNFWALFFGRRLGIRSVSAPVPDLELDDAFRDRARAAPEHYGAFLLHREQTA